ncbi:MAG TPA: carboxy-S-adenosyl-L-methionine synthase CmoA [Chromatiaceae bacterium]|nr:carboxy-S-adenosyl-L-methionine synthase CmoA [Chromatiaceae bacterium]
MNPSERDRLYADPRDEIERFVFDERVAAVFGDMIVRSVPGYATIAAMTGILARQHAVPGSRIYDLGCSLGAATAVMATSLEANQCDFIAVDKAPAMLERAREQFLARRLSGIRLICADIRDVVIERASVVVLNFTLQFLPVVERLTLLKRIRQGMLPGGVLILSEKIAGDSEEQEQLLVELHEAFKLANGYSELEIAQKRAALEQVMLPEPVDIHRQRLDRAGFGRVDLWFQCFNFVSFLARP